MPKLTLTKAGETLWSHEYGKDYITIGRHSFADVPLDSTMVSRHHAVIRYSAQEGGYVIEDAGSSNGVQLNGEEIKRASLSDGDRIQVGSYLIIFERGDAAADDASNPAQRRAKSGIDEGHRTFELPRKNVNK